MRKKAGTRPKGTTHDIWEPRYGGWPGFSIHGRASSVTVLTSYRTNNYIIVTNHIPCSKHSDRCPEASTTLAEPVETSPRVGPRGGFVGGHPWSEDVITKDDVQRASANHKSCHLSPDNSTCSPMVVGRRFADGSETPHHWREKHIAAKGPTLSW